MEESKQEQNKKRNRSLFIYVSLGLLIFFGVQRYNQTINAPENSTFSEFQTQINQGLVTEATIKEQSNTVEYKLANNDSLFQTDYPEGFEGEIFKLLIDQNIVLNTDTEPAGMQDYFIAFLPWIFLAGFMFFMFSQVRSNGNQIMQFGKSKAKELDEESPKAFKNVEEQIEISAHYSGYLEKQEADILTFRKDENLKIPEGIDYDRFSGLSNEVKAKFKQIRPKTLGQALRIDGITPAAAYLLLSHVKKMPKIRKMA